MESDPPDIWSTPPEDDAGDRPEESSPPPPPPPAARARYDLGVGEVNVLQEPARAIEGFEDKRRRGDRVFLIVGVRASGKTVFSYRLKDYVTGGEWAKFQGRAVRTRRGTVNIVDIPDYPLFCDLAGEDFEMLASVTAFNENFEYFSKFLWRAVRHIDGILVLIDFPIIWYEYNRRLLGEGRSGGDEAEPEREPGELAARAVAGEREIESAVKKFIQMTLLSRDWERLRRRNPRYFGSDGGCPSHDDIGNWAHSARRLDLPLFVVLSKADALASGSWAEGMVPPHLGLHVDPRRVGARELLKLRMPDLYRDLRARVRHFAVGYAQSFDGHGDVRPEDIKIQSQSPKTFLGHKPIVAFLDKYPWHLGPPLFTAARLNWLHNAWRHVWRASA